MPGFGGEFFTGLLRRRGRDDDEVLARRALDLFSAEAVVALQMLVAMRTGKLELAHGRQGSRRGGKRKGESNQ